MAKVVDPKSQPREADITPEDDKVSTSSSYKKLTGNLRQLEAKRRTFRRTLQQYERIKDKFTDVVGKLNKKEPTGEKGSAANADPEKQKVIASYRLLRNFCISYNTVY